MNGTDYDLVIVGAGIHGAGIAQAAAAAGHRVLVLEQRGVAAGTSSRSSKLIHGGLRYLEQYDLRLVRECLRERELLLRLAPQLVHLTPFYIPVYRHTRRRPWQIRAGLSLYALLGGLQSHARFQQLPQAEWSRLEGLRSTGLQAVFRYFDAQTDDAQLTRAVMRSAGMLGTELCIPATFLGAETQGDACGVKFSHNGSTREVRTRVLVNAAGPWVRQVAACIRPVVSEPLIDLVQGTHLVLDQALVRNIYYVEAPQDGRAVFIMPWYERTLVGTTETLFTGADPGSVQPLAEEQRYLLDVVHAYFPDAPLSVHAAFAGLRVLPRDVGRAFRRSREILFVTDRPQQPRVLGVYGGKLTSYRTDAERTLRRLHASLPSRKPVADTRTLPLTDAG